jgi:hypothetical protein
MTKRLNPIAASAAELPNTNKANTSPSVFPKKRNVVKNKQIMAKYNISMSRR